MSRMLSQLLALTAFVGADATYSGAMRSPMPDFSTTANNGKGASSFAIWEKGDWHTSDHTVITKTVVSVSEQPVDPKQFLIKSKTNQ